MNRKADDELRYRLTTLAESFEDYARDHTLHRLIRFNAVLSGLASSDDTFFALLFLATEGVRRSVETSRRQRGWRSRVRPIPSDITRFEEWWSSALLWLDEVKPGVVDSEADRADDGDFIAAARVAMVQKWKRGDDPAGDRLNG